jgi:hypothetical protein
VTDGNHPMMPGAGLLRTLVELLEASHLASVEDVPRLVAEHGRHAGLGNVQIYLADLQQNTLRRLGGPGDEPGPDADELRIDGTLPGRAFQEVRILASSEAGVTEHWWVPLLDGTERVGVLRITAAPGADEGVVDRMRHLASLIALILVSKRAYSDSYAKLVRTAPMNVAAEMQWNLMPPLTFADREVTIGAVMEPAYEIGGDAFDYSVRGRTVHVAIFDAMGHDVSAGLSANLAVAACRNHRRQGMELAPNSDAIEDVLIEEFGRATRFVTAIMMQLDVDTGVLTWVNRGHHPPVLIRGGRWISTLTCPPAHPMGLDLGLPVTLCQAHLEPGDRILLYTDGITEMRNARGEEFGLHRFVDFMIRQNAAGLPVPETLRRLIRNVLDYHDNRLHDDATVLLLEWQGGAI